ncbi:hypothetical protein BZA77DRAFT_245351 [Pyronema omphalodes]|nr:hypothetical protein BZA77DRAFT_245351 [Pyronema omphalodes]
MRVYNLSLLFVLLSSALLVVADSDPRLTVNPNDYDTLSLPNTDTIPLDYSEFEQEDKILERRRGGGGRGGGGGSRSGSGRNGGVGGVGVGGGVGRGGQTQRTSSNKFSKGQNYGSKTNSASNSNVGGSTSAGSGSPRSFGSYYGGGAVVPYSAGRRSNSGIVPVVLAGAALGAISGLLIAGAFAYPFTRQYNFHNDTSGRNERLPVTCICEKYQVCGCDETGDEKFLNQMYNQASDTDPWVSKVADLNGRRTLILNGTLMNGTTAPGGSDDENAAMALNINWKANAAILMAVVAALTVV